MDRCKPGISANRHIEIGARLSEMRDEIVALEVELGNAYPRSGPNVRMTRALTKARVALDDAKNHGDSMSCNEYPELWCCHWYYPRDWEEYGEMPHTCGICQRHSANAEAIQHHCEEHGTVRGPQYSDKDN